MISFPKNIHCAGIGGIGLSALAQLLRHEGHFVTGSDREESPITEMLVARGIEITIGQTTESLPSPTELLIFSDALPEDNPERVAAKERGVLSMSYFEALGKVSEGKRTIAVSGTHGKTTTTAMITKILVDLGESPTAVIGSLTKDFESNFVAGDSDIFVVEACEYRRHFLHLSPLVLVITNMEWDHTDFFRTFDDVVSAFQDMCKKVRDDGVIVSNGLVTSTLASLKNGAAHVVFYEQENAPKLNMIGSFNEMNAKAAKAAVRALIPDADEEKIDASLQSFKGTWRRFDYKGVTKEGAIVYDDYAHHPTAVKGTITGAKEKFPDKRITVVFHPHLYSRTKSLLTEFAHAFSDADNVIIAPIYAAREKPDPDISNEILAEAIRNVKGNVVAIDSFEEIEKVLRKSYGSNDLIITMGAGDIYKVAESIVRVS